MKTASLVLGIIGGVLAIIFAIVFIVSGALVNTFADSFSSGMDELTEQLKAEGWEVTDNAEIPANVSGLANAAAGSFWIIGILSIIGAVLGIVGGALAKKKNIVAGVLLLIAAVPSFFTGLGFLASILFIVGGILALIPEKPAQNAPAA